MSALRAGCHPIFFPLVLSALSLAGGSAASRVECYDYPAHLPHPGETDTPGVARDVVVSGEHALADGDAARTGR
jgi:hypothetical protein